MAAPRPKPILRARVKPARLHPLMRHVPATTDMTWILLCVGLAAAALRLALW